VRSRVQTPQRPCLFFHPNKCTAPAFSSAGCRQVISFPWVISVLYPVVSLIIIHIGLDCSEDSLTCSLTLMRSAASLAASSPTRRSGGPAGRRRGTRSHSHTQCYPHPSSIDRAPSPSYPIALKFSKNIEQQPYDGSLVNQYATTP
jgi:hypothetical protein